MADLETELQGRLSLLHERVVGLVEHRSAGDPTAAEPLRGMFLSPEAVQHLIHRPPVEVSSADGYGRAGTAPDGRIGRLAERFALDPLDLHILVVALAPDVNRRFEPLYGYLNDDVSRRRATVSLALELCGLGPEQATARGRFHASAPLVAGGLLMMDEDPLLPLPSRALRVPERVIAHLLGDDTLDGALTASVQVLVPPDRAATDDEFAGRLAALLAVPDGGEGQAPVVHLHETRTGSGVTSAVLAGLATGRPVLRWQPDEPGLLPVLIREARLRDAAIVAGPLPSDPAAPAGLVRALEAARVPVVLVGTDPYDPSWSASGTPIPLEAPGPRPASARLWVDELGSHATGIEVGLAIASYRLGPEQIRPTVRAALALATLDGGPLSAAHLQHAARRQSAPLLDRHARRVSPGVNWSDLVLPAEPLAALHELTVRARQREKVLGEWRMRTGGGRGRGVVALFAGESGTGKTMSAEVVAGELGMDLYVVDLSSIMDKYIGETEKNLERIFSEADQTDAVLLFDEADAVFGKRSEVKDSHDKHANLQSAYLLQRLESFDGIALLTTNLRANIDEAFTRRLDLVVDFPFPDPEQRALLWRHCLAGAPCASDLEIDQLATRFELAGGAIHSAAVTAAYLAAGRDGLLTAVDLRTGAEREYRKLGRLVLSLQ